MSELSSNPNGTYFSFTEARKLIGDLTKPKPWIYWVDFVTSIVLGHAALHLVFFVPRWYGWTPLAIAGLLISYALTVILYMRALMFIHELVHLPKKGFEVSESHGMPWPEYLSRSLVSLLSTRRSSSPQTLWH